MVPLDRLPAALLALDPAALLDLGVLALSVHPGWSHLAVALLNFVRRVEPRYAVAALVVLVLLAGSAILAFTRH